MKRARTSGGSVTGGTGDVKPQIFTMNTGIAGAPNDYVVNRVALPVPRFGSTKTKATIMEILWVHWYLALENLADSSVTEFGYLTTSTTHFDGEATSAVTMAADVEDPRTFAYVASSTGLVTTGGFHKFVPIRIDLTDSNGNGTLIATDQLFIVGGGIAQTVVGTYVAKIGYRLVNVGITEYVGIVQSQQ